MICKNIFFIGLLVSQYSNHHLFHSKLSSLFQLARTVKSAHTSSKLDPEPSLIWVFSVKNVEVIAPGREYVRLSE